MLTVSHTVEQVVHYSLERWFLFPAPPYSMSKYPWWDKVIFIQYAVTIWMELLAITGQHFQQCEDVTVLSTVQQKVRLVFKLLWFILYSAAPCPCVKSSYVIHLFWEKIIVKTFKKPLEEWKFATSSAILPEERFRVSLDHLDRESATMGLPGGPEKLLRMNILKQMDITDYWYLKYFLVLYFQIFKLLHQKHHDNAGTVCSYFHVSLVGLLVTEGRCPSKCGTNFNRILRKLAKRKC